MFSLQLLHFHNMLTYPFSFLWTGRVAEEMNVAVVDDAALVVVGVQRSGMVLVDSLWYQDGHKAAHPGLLTQPLADCPSTYDPQVHTSVAFEDVQVDGLV